MIDSMPDILLIEDNKYNVEFILEALEKNGIVNRVKVFHDGEKALDYLFAAGEYAGRDSFESGSERIPRSLLRGKRANGEHYYSLGIEDSPQFTAVRFKSLFTLIS